MDKITLSDKAEKEIVNASKMAAFASYTENSQNLMTIEEIALYLNKSYTFTVKYIVTKGDFPQSRYFSDKNERPRLREIAFCNNIFHCESIGLVKI